VADPNPHPDDRTDPTATPAGGDAPGAADAVTARIPGGDDVTAAAHDATAPTPDGTDAPDAGGDRSRADADGAEPRGVPDEATLARVAEPARVRHAPKFGAFIVAGVLLGALVGLLAAALAGSSSGLAESDPQAFISVLGGQGGARAVSAFIGAVVGGFAGAGAALVADRRSRRR